MPGLPGQVGAGVSRVEPLHARLTRRLVWADGAMGTMLQASGLAPGEPPERWNVVRPEAVAAVHAAYLAVGCDFVTTNTFGANRLRLGEYRLESEVEAINHAAVRIARTVGKGEHLVAGGVGPTGRFQRGRGAGPPGEVRSAFEEQVSSLAEAGVDLVLIETMTHLAEACTALEAVRSCPPVPVGVTMVFSEHQGKLRTLDGATPREAVYELRTAAMIGCNCMDIKVAAEALTEMQEAAPLPLIAQPHAGLPGTLRTPGEMARLLPALLQPGVAILGGCCGTTPAHIKALMHAARTR